MKAFETVHEWINWFQARPPTRQFYRAIPNGRVKDDPKPGSISGQAFEAESSYVSIRIAELHLKNGGEYFRNFLPVGIILSEFSQGGQKRAQPFFLNNQRLKQALGMDADDLGWVPMENVYALRYVPVNADGLSMFCGLFRVVHQDFAAALLDLISEIGGHIAGSAIGESLEIAKAVYARLGSVIGLKGVEFLLGHLDGSSLDHGSGYRVFAGAAMGDRTLDDLWMIEGRLRHSDAERTRPVTEFDYCVLAVERLETRAQANLLTTLPLHQQWLKVVPHLTGNRLSEAEAEFQKLQSEILLSPDLTEQDKLIALAVYQTKWGDVSNSIKRPGNHTRGPTASFRKGLTIESSAQRSAGKDGVADFGEIILGQLNDRVDGRRADTLVEAEVSFLREAVRATQKPASSSEVAAMLTAARLRA
ncbi:hypothetical protein Q3C01_15040 [Bradyrhizobium sp. UFLA05-109]